MSVIHRQTFVFSAANERERRVRKIKESMRLLAEPVSLVIDPDRPELALSRTLDYWQRMTNDNDDRERRHTFVGLMFYFRMLLCIGEFDVTYLVANHPMVARLFPPNVSKFAPETSELLAMEGVDSSYRFRLRERRAVTLASLTRRLRRMMKTIEAQLNLSIAYTMLIVHGRPHLQHAFRASKVLVQSILRSTFDELGTFPCTMRELGLTFEPKTIERFRLLPPELELERMLLSGMPMTPHVRATEDAEEETKSVGSDDGGTSPRLVMPVREAPHVSQNDILPKLIEHDVRDALGSDVIRAYMQYLWTMPGRTWPTYTEERWEQVLTTHPGLLGHHHLGAALRAYHLIFDRPTEIFLRPKNLFLVDVTVKIGLLLSTMVGAELTENRTILWALVFASAADVENRWLRALACAAAGALTLDDNLEIASVLATSLTSLRTIDVLTIAPGVGWWLTVILISTKTIISAIPILGVLYLTKLYICREIEDLDISTCSNSLMVAVGAIAILTTSFMRAVSDPKTTDAYRSFSVKYKYFYVVRSRSIRFPGVLGLIQSTLFGVPAPLAFGILSFVPCVVASVVGAWIWAVATLELLGSILSSQLWLAWRHRRDKIALSEFVFPMFRPLTWLWTSRRVGHRIVGVVTLAIGTVMVAAAMLLIPWIAACYALVNTVFLFARAPFANR